MNTYMIRRREAASTPDEIGAAAQRSKEVADSEFPDDIAWIRTYVVAETDGTLGTVCIYQASDEEAVRNHATKAGLPADEVLVVADTVIVRADPVPA